MYILRLVIVFALLAFNFSSKSNIEPPETSTEITSFDPCLLGNWKVDIPSLARALERPVSGSILITFETTPVNEITAGFDVVISRRPPQSSTKRREHKGTLSATRADIESNRPGAGRFMLTSIELGEENSHKRYKADGDWRNLDKQEIEDFFMIMVFDYKDCSPTMMYGQNEIILTKETY